VKDLIEYIARNLVDDPEQVDVTQNRRGPEIQFKLHVAKEDMGRVIGKQGRIANAIRTLVNVAAARSGKTVDLDIEDPR
jgi:predicted RNA-binding protein YlqC (UPF0109 family)